MENKISQPNYVFGENSYFYWRIYFQWRLLLHLLKNAQTTGYIKKLYSILCAEGFSLTFEINYRFAVSTDGNEIRPKLSSLLMLWLKKNPPQTKPKKLEQPESTSPTVYQNFMVSVCPTDPELFGSCREENDPAWVSSKPCHGIWLATRPRFPRLFFAWALILLLQGTNNANLHCLSITAQKSRSLALRNAHIDMEKHLCPTAEHKVITCRKLTF